ncbi:MAG TPA: ABC transporter substrate-binding protein [Caulobacteraceae bacterium]|nr:ABC transporter substrate-binding protein [Caulobacteraceae bacterium]
MDNRRRQRNLARIALATAIALTPALAAWAQEPAHSERVEAPRDQDAEQFVQAQGQRLVSILADKSQSTGDRMLAFRAAVDDVADVPRITRFVLGKYARTITPDQMRRFAAVFQDYVQTAYQQHLADFHGDTLTVTGSVVRKPGDVVVKTTITGADVKEPTQVVWRVMGSASNWKLVDVGVSGVWLAVTQQDDFVSTIDDHGGSIDALISRLQELARRRTSAPAADH